MMRVAEETSDYDQISSTKPEKLHHLRGGSVLSDEVDQLIAAAGRRGRYGHRDSTLIMLAYRHGLRVGEPVALRWEQVDLTAGLLHVTRLKRGLPATHPLREPELRALRRLQSEERSVSPDVQPPEDSQL